jgi:hypothetical protein
VPQVQATLELLLHLVRAAAPNVSEIARRAHEIAMWAEERGAAYTALTFAQLAQEVESDSERADPQIEFDLGRMAVSQQENREAGISWLELAAEHARALGQEDLAHRAADLAAEMRQRVGGAV